MTPRRVLFLCTGNACRSQMAEGWARHLWGAGLAAVSAGTDPHGVDPRAVEVMREVGVDLSAHRSKSVEEFLDGSIDVVVTVCDRASGSCPVFPGKARTIHHGFDDPPALARTAPDAAAATDAYRRVRDEIRAFVRDLGAELGSEEGSRGGV